MLGDSLADLGKPSSTLGQSYCPGHPRQPCQQLSPRREGRRRKANTGVRSWQQKWPEDECSRRRGPSPGLVPLTWCGQGHPQLRRTFGAPKHLGWGRAVRSLAELAGLKSREGGLQRRPAPKLGRGVVRTMFPSTEGHTGRERTALGQRCRLNSEHRGASGGTG